MAAIPPQYQAAMDMFGKKWMFLILCPLTEGPCRFTDISAFVSGLSDRLLSQRLQELEEKGVVERRVYNERPVRIEYRLTEKGQELSEVLDAIMRWADRWETAEAPTKS